MAPQERQPHIRVLERQPPWAAYLLEVSGFPIPAEEAAAVRTLLWKLVSEQAVRTGTNLETYILINELHQGNAAELVAANGAAWLPSVGLAVWPDRPVNGLWTREMVENLRVGENPPPSFFQILQVTSSKDAKGHAFRTMTGFGALIAVLTKSAPDQFKEACKQILYPTLPPPVYTAFPMYLPLFDIQSALASSTADLDRWSAGAEVYVRELHHDKGILLLSKEPLDRTLRVLGCELSSSQGAAVWSMKA
jgi:hypothetical protein